jgi:hypothetical protein
MYFLHMPLLFKIIFFLGFVFLSSIAIGQTLGSWNIVNVKYNHNKTWSGFAEAQLRSLKFYDNYHYYEVKGGVNYKAFKNLQFTLAAGSYQTYKEGGNFKLPKNNNEFRLWPQVLLTQEIKKLKVEQRYRWELRWTSNGYRNRFRYRLGVTYPLGTTKNGYQPIILSVNNEVFFGNKEPYFERNRIQANLQYKINKLVALQLGYLHQFDYRINDEIGRDFLVIGFYYELFKKTAPKQ